MAKANTLMADQFFSPGLLLAEHIERGIIPVERRSMVELGAGCAVPSLLASTLAEPPVLVVITDYPDDAILRNLSQSLERNRAHVTNGCAVHCLGHDWGKDVSPLLDLSPARQGYDIVILSDLLHFDASHSELLASLISLLLRSPTARTYVAAGKYTPPKVCDNFLRAAEREGLLWEEGDEESKWLGTLPVRGRGLDKENLGVRKTMCRWWIGKWSEDALR
ncbi:hypothetical protein GLOTRDRAFT_132185 [Gloeophyllum trabeum ATCC 11539]|uniref:Nicotinamide N-methyltransferase n=1 Tax=Gloeophyllum trabeum (strain ATCC 11539 / FP-39264 / Madison 617) TaxID=670483 RepID=S7PWR9_GLOTA|nr:uncharacterized protein GLOTRDRAFT_132185 [Gloeophyllum trabeum ATCC 11539]EPQ52061.1 hypothetical protein GLOTRDRAFT_132185 [Gloeophyllum trabeum ATCC 11539]